MNFWDMVAADSAKLVGTGGETTETVQLVGGSLSVPVSLPATVARGQEGPGAINDRNRSLFDPELNALTSGRILLVVFNDGELLASAGTIDLELGWGLILPSTPTEGWDFARIESRGGGLTTALFTRREPKTVGPRIGKRARGW